MGGGVRWRIGRALGQGRSPDRIGPNCSETARPLAGKNSPGLAAGSNTRLGWTLQHNELEIEEHCDGHRPRMMGGVEGYSEDQVEYHLRLLVNAGYVETSKSSKRFVRGLTLAGHDYLDSIRPSELAVRIGQSRSRLGGGVTVPLSSQNVD